MKKVFFALLLAVVSLGANAQFEKGTHYGEASLTNFGLGYHHNQFAIGFNAGYGYYVADNWMLGGRLGFNHPGDGDNRAQVQALFRYSFKKNGLNLGCGIQYEHGAEYQSTCFVPDPDSEEPNAFKEVSCTCGGDYIQLCPQVGYTFYLNHYISVEPALFADICLNDIKWGTNFGLKVGIGLYYNKKHK